MIWSEADEARAVLGRRVQRWSWRRGAKTLRTTGEWASGNFGEAARSLKVTVQEVADAVEAHPYLLTLDTDLPLPIRKIEHEGE